MYLIIKKKTWNCFSCNKNLKKKEFIKKVWIYICPHCWYYNWESIFNEYKEIENPKLIFWQHIIKKGKVKEIL